MGLLPRPSALVLDNFQEVAEGAPFRGMVHDAVAEMPEGANLIVVSRNEPPAEFARLRASGSLAEIGWEELRLTREETEAIASLRGECREDAAREWAAGLTLLMQQGGRTGGVPDAPRGASPQALFDYFAAEVFDRAAGELRQFWLRTAFMPHFSVESARKLSGSEAAERLLDTLYRQRCFIERRRASAATYQYHALFREFLRHHVERGYTTVERRQLAHRSARVLEEQGDPDAALALYIETVDRESALRLVLQQAAPLFAQGRWQTLQGWIGALPRTTVETTPWLLYWAGACQAQSDPPAGRATIEQAYARFVDNADIVGQALSACAVLESCYVEWGQLRRARSVDRRPRRHRFPGPGVSFARHGAARVVGPAARPLVCEARARAGAGVRRARVGFVPRQAAGRRPADGRCRLALLPVQHGRRGTCPRRCSGVRPAGPVARGAAPAAAHLGMDLHDVLLESGGLQTLAAVQPRGAGPGR